MNSKLLILLVTILSLSFINDSLVLRKITIHYINKDIETPYNVSCGNFERFFGKDEYKAKVIQNQAELQKVANCVNNVKKSPSFIKDIDVRAKLILSYSNGMKTTICIDRFDNAVFDDKYVVSKSGLYSFVLTNCEGFK